jgi:uncharacterized protein (DUF433 family)
VEETGMATGKIYGGKDPRSLPAYSIAEAAIYLNLPSSTLRTWVRGRYYPTDSGTKFSVPLLLLPEGADENPPYLSFINLIEANVLCALRRQHKLSMLKVREALDYLKMQFPSDHPLAEHNFATDGLNLFIEHYGELVKITDASQLVLRQVIEAHLRRVEWDESGLPTRFYPLARSLADVTAKVIVIDPRLAFGRPVLVGTGIRTEMIADRYYAGESIDDIAKDYRRSRMEIEEVIRCHYLLTKAA